ncbi:MAG TPA: TIGR03435 family protein [Bryobacteraceae bacterium]|jgi:uncharacterized protein (TIGR03435 family)|nr:TIGR03435 family protein [Bryobacteraceae bacterium]
MTSMKGNSLVIQFLSVSSLLLSVCAAAEIDRPSFEAASVKRVQHGRPGIGPLRGGPGSDSPGQISGAASLKDLLMRAYEMKAYQIDGPSWMDTERYQILAKISVGATPEQVAIMLQSLLAERFHLVVHREIKELPFYAMLIGRNGAKLKSSQAVDQNPSTPKNSENGVLRKGTAPRFITGQDGFPDLSPGADLPRSYQVVVGGSDGILFKLWARQETMQQLADRMSSQLSRAVVDMTGLKGEYDFALSWTIDGGSVPRTNPPPDEIDIHSTPVLPGQSLSIFTALQNQLGLRLEQRRGPLTMLIVDGAEKSPVEN